MTTLRRYLRLWLAFMRYCLSREMAFRANFLFYAATELFWLGLLVAFFHVIYGRTSSVGGWTADQMLLLIGTHFIITRPFQGLFFESLVELSDLIRTGRLDFLLTKPADPQFLVSFSRVDYSSLVNVAVGGALVLYAGGRLGLQPGPADVALYLLLVVSGVVILYSLMFLLSSTAVWSVRATFVYEGWFHLTSFGRYPEAIYKIAWLRALLTYIVPVLIVANWPARLLLSSDPGKLLDPWQAALAVALAAGLFWGSRLFFLFALRSYKSASS
jgi:ABC-2 type transport system permease protein